MLVTDRYETIRSVIECLGAQTAREELELVVVGPAAGELRAEVDGDGFAAVTVVDVGSPVELGEARAAGVRAASAPLVFIGETHSYPHPRMAEELIRAHAGPWASVAPHFGNGNPADGATSWAGFLSDYGAWVAGVGAGEIRYAPIYNASYRRSALIEFGDRLGIALRGGDEMPMGMRARGHRVYFEPAARVEHVNVSIPSAWIRERYLAGRLISAGRARRWSWPKRLLYLLASPLLPFLYLSRIRAGVLTERRSRKVPSAAFPLLVVCAFIKASGEMVGYARGGRPGADSQMMDYELHRVRYVSSGQR